MSGHWAAFSTHCWLASRPSRHRPSRTPTTGKRTQLHCRAAIGVSDSYIQVPICHPWITKPYFVRQTVAFLVFAVLRNRTAINRDPDPDPDTAFISIGPGSESKKSNRCGPGSWFLQFCCFLSRYFGATFIRLFFIVARSGVVFLMRTRILEKIYCGSGSETLPSAYSLTAKSLVICIAAM
jgi:hypothetical protein